MPSVRLGERAGRVPHPRPPGAGGDGARHQQGGGAACGCGHETGAGTVVFAGDDVADEEAMATLGPLDVGVRVGREPSVARVRVDDPADVVAVLDALARQLAAAG